VSTQDRVWDDVISERDREIYALGGLGQTGGLGQRPLLLVVDVTYDFTGDRPEPTHESVRRFPLSCGEDAWQALPRIRKLLEAARGTGIPVIYTRQAPRPNLLHAGRWARKNARVLEPTEDSRRIGDQIPEIIAPLEDEIVIAKDKPSAFFGTPLVSYLTALGIDTLIVAGTSTSGCVRATVVDAFSLNYAVVVVEDCVFDRGSVSHKVNLFDMQAKYADVLSLEQVTALIGALPDTAGTPTISA
jgi:maleamate amidohydrolase